MPLLEVQTLVDNLVRDDASVVDATARDVAISLAVIRYSKDRPDEAVEDVVSAGGQYLDLPASWQDNFSVIKSLEYPVGDVPPTILGSANYGIYNSPANKKIMISDSLAAADVVRVTFTVKHVIDLATETSPDTDREAIASWAGALLCDQLSSYYSGDSDSTIAADSVNHANKSRDFATRAKNLRKFYLDALGIDPKRNVAAGVVVDLDLNNSLGTDRLTHGGRSR